MTQLFSKKYLTIFILIVILLLLFFFILPISVPLVVAFFTALILNPLVRFGESRLKIGRKLSVTIIFILFVLSLGLIGYFTVTSVIRQLDRKSTRLNSSHVAISYAVFCLKKITTMHRASMRVR